MPIRQKCMSHKLLDQKLILDMVEDRTLANMFIKTTPGYRRFLKQGLSSFERNQLSKRLLLGGYVKAAAEVLT